MNAPRSPAGRDRPRSIALVGSRGIPGRYGGFETLFEELAARLASAGWQVSVYCRSHVTPPGTRLFRGARLIVLPTLRTKYLDTPVHTLLSCLHALFRRYDAVVLVNAANAIFIPLLRLAGTPVALNVDGIEKRRAKWGIVGRWVYAVSERLACRLPSALITDAKVIQDHYLARYGAASTLITYGVDARPPETREVLARLGLEPGRYFLYVSRFEPENNPHRVAEAYRSVRGDLPLVMVGGAPYARRFIESFTRNADPRIVFPGPIYGEGYRELLSNAYAYVQATEVGGTHPALVEAMGYGCCLLVNETPENREVAADTAIYFDAANPASLAAALERIREDPAERLRRGSAAASRARDLFSWDRVCESYQDLLARIAR